MPKITDYTAVTTLTPSDTLMDVSIDIATTPKTRSITIENLATSMGVASGSFYDNDGVITDPVREVDLQSNTLFFTKGRVGINESIGAGDTFVVNKYGSGDLIARFTSTTNGNAGAFDDSTTAGDTRFLVYDVNNGTLSRVTVGANDSGGAGHKVLRVPN